LIEGPANAARACFQHRCVTRRGPVMNTLLITTQIVCYGIGIVSASLNIASFMRLRRNRRRRGVRQAQWSSPISVR
jgi:hypothetical protein